MIVHLRTKVIDDLGGPPPGEHNTVPKLVFAAPDPLSGRGPIRGHRPRFCEVRRGDETAQPAIEPTRTGYPPAVRSSGNTVPSRS